MSDQFTMDLNADPRGQVLLKIQDMTNEVTDGFAVSDPKYIPVYEGFTSFDTGHSSARVYLVITKGVRVLLYGVEVPSIPKSFMFSRAESDIGRFDKSRFTCARHVLDHPDDIAYLLGGEDDLEIRGMKSIVPEIGQSSEDFILGNALWLANPTLN